VLGVLAPSIASGRAPLALLEALIEAHHAALEPAALADDAALVAKAFARETPDTQPVA